MDNQKEMKLISFLNEMIQDLYFAIKENEENRDFDLARDNRNKLTAYKVVLSFVEKGGIE